ncbi:MAG: Co2+/Mg2+ efflux protein ApaG [Chitinophagales bacterium]|nr:Co2+/Mg2+ efflux protein ApaG [Chitinophagales bacterium]MCO5280814.1 Co2+/Mg2+ efflux protein ApaG [Chitinophagales bacterium]OJV25113.1 MAG: Co2+/Mg2+ efflux protein ApaG [Bacteroidetes bacterium 37-13]HRN93226.1 Co2+/Mg2+ efflux protein ApaG [Chitinophagales bacterium]HRP39550.1 Co2+/Mg2+ efflux protein ApaG [Chitinophagales bacterium]
METATSSGIRIIVESVYSEHHSMPAASRYLYLYKISIRNLNPFPVQLQKRHWIITSGTGRVEHVWGEGVIGEYPLLATNEVFEYTSSCPLETAIGIMEGEYTFENKISGAYFEVEIPRFLLLAPILLN